MRLRQIGPVALVMALAVAGFVVARLLAEQGARRDSDRSGNAEPLVDEALKQAKQGNSELRELAHGILAAVLTRGRLWAGVDAFVARLDLPVGVDIPGGRFPRPRSRRVRTSSSPRCSRTW